MSEKNNKKDLNNQIQNEIKEQVTSTTTNANSVRGEDAKRMRGVSSNLIIRLALVFVLVLVIAGSALTTSAIFTSRTEESTTVSFASLDLNAYVTATDVSRSKSQNVKYVANYHNDSPADLINNASVTVASGTMTSFLRVQAQYSFLSAEDSSLTQNLKTVLSQLNNNSVHPYTDGAYKWLLYSDGYYYLVDSSNTPYLAQNGLEYKFINQSDPVKYNGLSHLNLDFTIAEQEIMSSLGFALNFECVQSLPDISTIAQLKLSASEFNTDSLKEKTYGNVLSFDTNGGNHMPAILTTANSLTLTDAYKPTRDGYEFVCWEQSGTTINEVLFTQNPLQNIIAKWRPKSYGITYKDLGGKEYSGSEITEPHTYTYGNQTALPTNITKLGHTFQGWFLDPNGTRGISAIQPTQTGDITVYAKWMQNNLTITYADMQDAVFTSPAQSTFKYGSNDVITLPTAFKFGFTFQGWYTEPNGQGEKLTYLLSSEYTENITIYAYFTADTYTITFLTNGGVAVIEDGQIKLSNITYMSNKPFTLHGEEAVTREGYNLLGWKVISTTSSNWQNNAIYLPNSTYTQTPTNYRYGNVTLQAEWQVRVVETTLELYSQGTLISGESHIVSVGETVVLNPNLNFISDSALTSLDAIIPQKAGYVFIGWNREESATGVEYTNTYKVLEEHIFAGKITLHAIWMPVSYYAITNNPNNNTQFSAYAVTEQNQSVYLFHTADLSLAFAGAGKHQNADTITYHVGNAVANGKVAGALAITDKRLDLSQIPAKTISIENGEILTTKASLTVANNGLTTSNSVIYVPNGKTLNLGARNEGDHLNIWTRTHLITVDGILNVYDAYLQTAYASNPITTGANPLISILSTNGQVNIYDGTFTHHSNYSSNQNIYSMLFLKNGKLNIENGYFSTSKTGSIMTIYYDANITILDGTFVVNTSKTENLDGQILRISDGSIAVIENGKFTAYKHNRPFVIFGNSNVTINGGEFESERRTIVQTDTANVTINGGKISANSITGESTIGLLNGNLTINGAEIVGQLGNALYATNENSNITILDANLISYAKATIYLAGGVTCIIGGNSKISNVASSTIYVLNANLTIKDNAQIIGATQRCTIEAIEGQLTLDGSCQVLNTHLTSDAGKAIKLADGVNICTAKLTILSSATENMLIKSYSKSTAAHAIWHNNIVGETVMLDIQSGAKARIEANGGAGIYLENGTYSNISGGVITSLQNHAIYVDNATTTIAGNAIVSKHALDNTNTLIASNPALNALQVLGTSKVNISGNAIVRAYESVAVNVYEQNVDYNSTVEISGTATILSENNYAINFEQLGASANLYLAGTPNITANGAKAEISFVRLEQIFAKVQTGTATFNPSNVIDLTYARMSTNILRTNDIIVHAVEEGVANKFSITNEGYALLYDRPTKTLIIGKENRVQYDFNGGEGTIVDTNIYQVGQTVNVQFTPIPTRSGYAFLGWSYEKYTSKAEFESDGVKTFTMPENSVTLYAVWKLRYVMMYYGSDKVNASYYASLDEAFSAYNKNTSNTETSVTFELLKSNLSTATTFIFSDSTISGIEGTVINHENAKTINITATLPSGVTTPQYTLNIYSPTNAFVVNEGYTLNIGNIIVDGCKGTQARDENSGRLAYLTSATSTLNLGAIYDASGSILITQTAKIQNFSVRKTTTDFTNLPYGGTVLMDGGTMTLHSGSIIQNSTTEFLPNGNLLATQDSGAMAEWGGSAIYTKIGSSANININSGATIYNCQNIFKGSWDSNNGTSGICLTGAIQINGYGNLNFNGTISDCSVIAKNTHVYTGALVNADRDAIRICGVGITSIGDSHNYIKINTNNATIKDCFASIESNTGYVEGVGMHISLRNNSSTGKTIKDMHATNLTITNCRGTGNEWFRGESRAGGIYVAHAHVELQLTNCNISHNYVQSGNAYYGKGNIAVSGGTYEADTGWIFVFMGPSEIVQFTGNAVVNSTGNADGGMSTWDDFQGVITIDNATIRADKGRAIQLGTSNNATGIVHIKSGLVHSNTNHAIHSYSNSTITKNGKTYGGVTIDAGTISTTSSNAIRLDGSVSTNYNNKIGLLVNAGTINSGTGHAIYSNNVSKVMIEGGIVTSSSSAATLYFKNGSVNYKNYVRLEIAGGTITNTRNTSDWNSSVLESSGDFSGIINMNGGSLQSTSARPSVVINSIAHPVQTDATRKNFSTANAVFNMSGGTITNIRTNSDCLQVWNMPFNMSGGTLNNAGSYAIWIAGEDSWAKVSGTANITSADGSGIRMWKQFDPREVDQYLYISGGTFDTGHDAILTLGSVKAHVEITNGTFKNGKWRDDYNNVGLFNLRTQTDMVISGGTFGRDASTATATSNADIQALSMFQVAGSGRVNIDITGGNFGCKEIFFYQHANATGITEVSITGNAKITTFNATHTDTNQNATATTGFNSMFMLGSAAAGSSLEISGTAILRAINSTVIASLNTNWAVKIKGTPTLTSTGNVGHIYYQTAGKIYLGETPVLNCAGASKLSVATVSTIYAVADSMALHNGTNSTYISIDYRGTKTSGAIVVEQVGTSTTTNYSENYKRFYLTNTGYYLEYNSTNHQLLLRPTEYYIVYNRNFMMNTGSGNVGNFGQMGTLFTDVYGVGSGAFVEGKTTIAFNTEFNLQLNAFARTGYTFTGWKDSSGKVSLADGAENVVVSGSPNNSSINLTVQVGSNTAITGVPADRVAATNPTNAKSYSLRLKAQWSEATYTVTLDVASSGSKFVSDNVATNKTATGEYGAELNLATYLPYREGYKFEGWIEEKVVGGKTYARIFYHNPYNVTTANYDAGTNNKLFSNANSHAEAKSTNAEVYKYSNLTATDITRSGQSLYTYYIELSNVYNGTANVYYNWTQTANPILTTIANGATNTTGFSRIGTNSTNVQGFNGLAVSSSSTTFLDGNVNHTNWYHTVGAYAYHNSGIPFMEGNKYGTTNATSKNTFAATTSFPISLWQMVGNGTYSQIDAGYASGISIGMQGNYYVKENITLKPLWRAVTYEVYYNADTTSAYNKYPAVLTTNLFSEVQDAIVNPGNGKYDVKNVSGTVLLAGSNATRVDLKINRNDTISGNVTTGFGATANGNGKLRTWNIWASSNSVVWTTNSTTNFIEVSNGTNTDNYTVNISNITISQGRTAANYGRFMHINDHAVVNVNSGTIFKDFYSTWGGGVFYQYGGNLNINGGAFINNHGENGGVFGKNSSSGTLTIGQSGENYTQLFGDVSNSWTSNFADRFTVNGNNIKCASAGGWEYYYTPVSLTANTTYTFSTTYQNVSATTASYHYLTFGLHNAALTDGNKGDSLGAARLPLTTNGVANGSFTYRPTTTATYYLFFNFGNCHDNKTNEINLFNVGMSTTNTTIPTFAKNFATGAGGVIFQSAGTTIVNNGTFTENSGTTNAGVFYQSGGTSTINSGIFSRNQTISSGSDGGVFRSNSGTFTINGGKFYANSSASDGYGGVIFASGGTLTLNGGQLGGDGNASTANSAQRGGAIAIGSSAVANLKGGVIGKSTNSAATASAYSNVASFCGGGVYCEGTLNLSYVSSGATTIAYNSVPTSDTDGKGGGGISILGTSAVITTTKGSNANQVCSVSYNFSFRGGGILFGDGLGGTTATGTLRELTAINITHNIAEYAGGILLNNCLKLGANVNISHNTAYNGGGGIWSDGKLEIAGATISNNTSSSNNGGGGIRTNREHAIITMTSGTISNNKCTANNGNGGAILLIGTDMTMSGGTISGNSTFTGINADSYGGGIYVDRLSSLTMSGGTVTQNISCHAGGIILEGSDDPTKYSQLTMSGTASVTKNVGTVGVGGIGAFLYSRVTITAGTISENTGAGYGGGLYCYGVDLSITNVTIDNNTAVGRGGGLYYINNGVTRTITLNGNINITNNTSTSNWGGGLCVEGEGLTFIIKKSQITGNTAYGGGGIFVGYKVEKIEISPNSNTDVNVSNNSTTTGDGGGLNIESWMGTLSSDNTSGSDADAPIGVISGGTFAGNVSKNNGGAINVTSSKNTYSGTIARVNLTISGGIFGDETETQASATSASNVAGYDGNEVNSGYGGAIHSGGAIVTITGGTFGRNFAFNNQGGAIMNSNWNGGGSLTLGGTVTFQYNTANTNGGAISNHRPLTINENSTINIHHNKASNGGGIYNAYNSITLPSGVTINDNNAVSAGAGLFTTTNATINGANIHTNASSDHGGGVSVSGGTFTLESGNIYLNTAVKNGGGVSVSGGTFTMPGGNIYRNSSADSGGGVFVGGGANFVMTGGVIGDGNQTRASTLEEYSNYAKAGGGVFGYAATINIYSTSTTTPIIAYNTSFYTGAGNNGGGVGLSKDSTLNIYAENGATTVPEIRYNNASRGGAINVYNEGSSTTVAYSTINLRAGKIHGNYARDYAGAIMLRSKNANNRAKLVMSGGEIFDNNSRLSGGGVGTATSTVEIEMSGGKIYNNVATGTVGGGIASDQANSIITLSGGEIVNNTAQTNGGGIYISSTITLDMSGVKIHGNKAVTGNGGGIYLNAGTLNLDGGSIYNNIATTNGGGVHVASGICNLKGSTIYQNKAVDGAGVYQGAGTFNMTSGTIGNDTNPNVATGNGGGLCVVGGIANISGGTIGSTAETTATSTSRANQAANGGGIMHTAGTLNIYSTPTIGHNYATVHGGGHWSTNGYVYFANGSSGTTKFTGKVQYNACGSNGGGLTFTSVANNVTIPNCTIQSNTAGNQSGGIYGGKAMTISGTIIKDNKAQYGGGVGIYSNTTISSGTIQNNEATVNGGGICLFSNVTLTMSGGDVKGNKAPNGTGGGLHMSQGTFNFSGGTIGDSTKTAVATDNAYSNTAKWGGGVYQHAGTFNLKGGTITYNYASSFTNNAAGLYMGGGGGIFSRGGFNMTSGTVKFNRAPGGGGMYLACKSDNTAATSTISGGNIIGNFASTDGGGVYVGALHTLTFSGGYIGKSDATAVATTSAYSNRAPYGGGLYVRGSATLSGGNIMYNYATTQGGGLSLQWNTGVLGTTKASVNMTAGVIKYNLCTGTWGGGVSMQSSGCELKISNSEVSYNKVQRTATITSAGTEAYHLDANGGGIAMLQGSSLLELSGTAKVNNNIAQSTLTAGGEFAYNAYARVFGPGIIANNLTATLNISGTAQVSNNQGIGNCTNNGTGAGYSQVYSGGIMAYNLTMSGGTISGNTLSTTCVTASGKANAYSWGGGVFIPNNASAVFNFTGGTISGNNTEYQRSVTCNGSGGVASGSYGGGLFLDNGTFTMSGGLIGQNSDTVATTTAGQYSNYAGYGGGIFSNAGTCNISGGIIAYNRAQSAGGGGIHVKGTVNLSGSVVLKSNIAAWACIEICQEAGTVNISGGTYVSKRAGSGISEAIGGTMNISGGTFTADSHNSYGMFYTRSNHKLNISGGIFNETAGGSAIVRSNATTTITGGTLDCKNTSSYPVRVHGDAGKVYFGGRVTLRGSTTTYHVYTAYASSIFGTANSTNFEENNGSGEANGNRIIINYANAAPAAEQIVVGSVETGAVSMLFGVYVSATGFRNLSGYYVSGSKDIRLTNNGFTYSGSSYTASKSGYYYLGYVPAGGNYGTLVHNDTDTAKGSFVFQLRTNNWTTLMTAYQNNTYGSGAWAYIAVDVANTTVTAQSRFGSSATKNVQLYEMNNDQNGQANFVAGANNFTLMLVQNGYNVQMNKIRLDGKRTTYNSNLGLNVQTGGTVHFGSQCWVYDCGNRGVYVDGTFSIGGGGRIQNNTVTGDGAGIYQNAGSITINNADYFITGNSATNHGGGVFQKSGTFNFSGGVIGKSDATAAATADAKSNYAGKEGGGVYVNNGTFTMTGTSYITYNYSGYREGGLCVAGGTSTINSTNAHISYNASVGQGGGVGIFSTGTKFIFTAGNIHHNKAPKGGAIRVGWDCSTAGNVKFNGANAKIYGNESTGVGGAILIESWTGNASSSNTGGSTANAGHLTIENCNIYDNVSASNGGAIYMEYSTNSYTGKTARSVLVMSGGTINSNDAVNGGGIYSEGGVVTISGGTIGNNTATVHGGGIWSNHSLTISGGTIRNNTATENGGGVSVSGGTFTMSGGTISSNTATENGGGVFVGGGANFVMTGGVIGDSTKTEIATSSSASNKCGRAGGGVCVNGTFTMKSTSSTTPIIAYNATTGSDGIYSGGGIGVINGTLNITSDSGATSYPEIRYNYGLRGGGIYGHNNQTTGTSSSNATYSTITLTAGFVHHNSSPYGGGVSVRSTDSTFNRCKVIMNGANAKIYSNNGTSAEGGLLVNGGVLEMSNGEIHSNISGGYAGGLSVANPIGQATITGGKIYLNTAATHGAGIHIDGATVTISNCQIYSNTATNYGGGVRIKTGTLNLFGGAIYSNTAVDGAGVYQNAGTITMNYANAKIFRNLATGNGGGVYVNGGSIFTMSGGEISSNTATDNGGGIYVDSGSTLNISGGTIGNDLAPNVAGNGGGGVFTSGTFNMTGGTIGSTATSTATPGSNGNRAIYGGGVHQSSGTFTFSGGKIAHNSASIEAGGVYVNSGSIFTMRGGEISSNAAVDRGGGVCNNNGIVNLEGGTIKNNSATDGGAAYSWGGTIKVCYDVTFSGNTGNENTRYWAHNKQITYLVYFNNLIVIKSETPNMTTVQVSGAIWPEGHRSHFNYARYVTTVYFKGIGDLTIEHEVYLQQWDNFYDGRVGIAKNDYARQAFKMTASTSNLKSHIVENQMYFYFNTSGPNSQEGNTSATINDANYANYVNGSTVFKSRAKYSPSGWFPSNKWGDQNFNVKFQIDYGGNRNGDTEYKVREHHNGVEYWTGGY